MKRNALIFSFLLALLLMPSFVDVTALASGATSENTWEIKTAIPIPEGVKKAAAVNGLIYILGGSINYEYNPTIDNWTIKAPMPTPRWHFGIAVNEDKIYTFGGWEASEIEVYNPASDTWETKTPLPSIITNPQANVIDNKIYVMSMEGSYCYNIANDSWSTISNAPYGSSQVAMDGKIYAFYGSHTNIYDPMSDSWREGAPMPVTIYQPSVCATTGIMAPKKIYLFGGIEQTFDSGTTLVQVYDPESDTWILGNTMPTGRSSSAITVVNDQIYVMGGSTGMYSITGANEKYTPFGYGTIPPVIIIFSPEDKASYGEGNSTFIFTVNRPVQSIKYSLDSQSNVTITGNTTFTNLDNGRHNITVYAEDTLGNIGASKTSVFYITKIDLFSTILPAVVFLGILVLGVVIIILRRKTTI